jgi:hypothetical protein
MRNLLTLLSVCAASTYVVAQTELPTKLQRAAAKAATPSPAAGRIDPTSRIGGELQQLYQQWQATSKGTSTTTQGHKLKLAAAFPDLTVLDGETVLVRITAKDVTALRPALEARGFEVISDKSKFHFIEGRLPVSALAPGSAGISSLASKGLLGVIPVFAPISNTGRIQNQADFLLEAARVRSVLPTGYDGTGVRIGIMSDSYNALNGAAAGIASGDLPANVQVLQDPTTGSDEGRAMIELIHDLAPGATKAFSGIYMGEANFADQIYRLSDPTLANCKILVDDISYLNEPMFQDGVLAQAVEEVVTTRGVAYYSSAGNYADKSSEYAAPTFTATTSGAADLDFGLSTGATTDTRQPFTIAASGSFRLAIQWSDPFYTGLLRATLSPALLPTTSPTRRPAKSLASLTAAARWRITWLSTGALAPPTRPVSSTSATAHRSRPPSTGRVAAPLRATTRLPTACRWLPLRRTIALLLSHSLPRACQRSCLVRWASRWQRR